MTVEVGDLVRVFGRGDWTDGLEGVVKNTNDGLVLIHFADARGRGHGEGRAHWYVNPGEVTLVSQTFKVGDKVVPNATSDYEERRGTVGIVDEVDYDDIPYRVKFDDGRSRWYRDDELDAFVEPVNPVWSVNDFVVVTSDYPAWAKGRIGVIEKIDDSEYTTYLIHIPGETKEGHGGDGMGDSGHGKWWMSKRDFMRLTPEALPAPVSGPTEEEIEQKQRRAIIDDLVAKLQAAYPKGSLEDEEAIEDILTRAGENFGVYLYLA